MLIKPEELLLPYWAMRTGQLSSLAFRLYFAGIEMRARRSVKRRHKHRLTSLQEVCKLVNHTKGQRVKAAHRELKTTGLVRWSPSEIVLIPDMHAVRLHDMDEYDRMLDRVGKCLRRKLPVPFPRRMVRSIAAGEFDAKGALAVILGVTLRCLRRKRMDGRHVTVSGGLCSTVWIADAFNVGQSTVKRWLSRMGQGPHAFITRLETAQRVQQRWGARTVVNLKWRGNLPASQVRMRPHRLRNAPAMRPPNRNEDLSPKSTYNQEPGATGPAGFRGGECSRSRRWSASEEDLERMPALIACYERAVEAGLLRNVERPKVSFVAAAMRAREICAARGGDAVRLFASTVWRRQWHFLNWEHEKAAEHRLQTRKMSEGSRTTSCLTESKPVRASEISHAVLRVLVGSGSLVVKHKC